MPAPPGTAADVRGNGWVFEVKWDGFRAVASVADGVAAFRSRGGIDLTGSYPELAELGALLGGHRAVLDGEIVDDEIMLHKEKLDGLSKKRELIVGKQEPTKA